MLFCRYMKPTETILFFDGVCHLCQASVQWVIRHDPSGKIQFASLQSPLAKRMLGQTEFLKSPDLETVVLWHNEQVFSYSTAALQVAVLLGWPYSVLRIFFLLPGGIRDFVYRWIARNRYRWFGKSESCWLPDPKWKDRFPEEGLVTEPEV